MQKTASFNSFTKLNLYFNFYHFLPNIYLIFTGLTRRKKHWLWFAHAKVKILQKKRKIWWKISNQIGFCGTLATRCMQVCSELYWLSSSLPFDATVVQYRTELYEMLCSSTLVIKSWYRYNLVPWPVFCTVNTKPSIPTLSSFWDPLSHPSHVQCTAVNCTTVGDI